MLEGGLLDAVARTVFALAGVCALAWVALNLLARRGIGVGKPNARLRLLERLSLSPRRQLYLVQADSRVFLLAAADGGAIALVTELTERAGLTTPAASAPRADVFEGVARGQLT